MTGSTGPPVNMCLALKVTGTAIGAGEIPQRTAALRHGPFHHLANRLESNLGDWSEGQALLHSLLKD